MFWKRKSQQTARTSGRTPEIRGLAEGLDVAVFLCRRDGVIEFANERAKRMFDFPEVNGRPILKVTLTHGLDKLVRKAAEDRAEQNAELNIRTDEDRVVIARAWPETASADRVYVTLLDVTNLRRLERIRSDFVANVSHELRTPLTTIRAMAEVLTDSEPDELELQQRYLRQIMGEVDRLSLIVDDLLTLGMAESRPLAKESVDLVELVDGIVLQLKRKADQKALQLVFESPETLRLEANPTQFSQVVMNLIDNALNYTTEGTVTVSLHETPEAAYLDVSDTGIGIPSEDLPRVFERFYRVDKSRSRESGGTGLGLSIVKHIVENHGGSVTVTSTLNRGSSFRVTIPK